jgi:adhesin transport system membrane fusion protein
MAEEDVENDFKQVGKSSLVYHPSKVSWSISEYISTENPRNSRIVLYSLIICFGAFFAFAYFSQVAISINITGNLDYKNPSPVLVNKNDMTINQILIKPNQVVQKGQTLLLGKAQLTGPLLKEMKDRKNEIFRLINIDKKGKCFQLCVKKLTNYSSDSFSLNPKVDVGGSLKDFLIKLSNEYKNYTNALNQKLNFPSTTLGLRNRIRQFTQKIRRIERKRAQNILKLEYAKLKGDLADVRSQLKEKENQLNNKVLQTRNVFTISLNNYSRNIKDYISGNQLKAPIKGSVVFLDDISSGQFIGARTKLFKILPVGNPLFAKSLVSNADISKIKVGDKVKISLNALPEREYGSVWGKIINISIDPKEDPQTKELKYESIIQLKSQNLKSYDGKTKNFKLGMGYNAKVITDYQSLLKVSVYKLLNIKKEYLGDLL